MADFAVDFFKLLCKEELYTPRDDELVDCIPHFITHQPFLSEKQLASGNFLHNSLPHFQMLIQDNILLAQEMANCIHKSKGGGNVMLKEYMLRGLPKLYLEQPAISFNTGSKVLVINKEKTSCIYSSKLSPTRANMILAVQDHGDPGRKLIDDLMLKGAQHEVSCRHQHGLYGQGLVQAKIWAISV
ncbi:hypothetical protein LIER_32655 [Lithospermum erythrorhizon]|uniref:Uncharacterized protein n=1 Tax=Lithospermum erythrorhizon TaxID=34254 RepID=A0AAV3RYC6_LITER